MSNLLANDEGDKQMKLGTVHRSGIYFMAEENPRKSQPRDCLMNAV